MSKPSSATTASRPVRLAHLVSHPIQYYVPLLREIAKQPDIDLTVLYMSDFSVKEYKDPGFGTAVAWDIPLLGGYKHEFLPYRGKAYPVRGFNQWHTHVRSTLKNGQFDILWSHGYALPTNLRFLNAARSMGIKTIVRADSQMASAQGAGVKRKVKEIGIRKIFSSIDAFFAAGTRNREYYAYYGVPDEKLFLVPFAVDNDFFQSRVAEAKPHREELRKALGLATGRPIIFTASKFIPRKRVIDLIEAYAKLSPDGKLEPLPYLLIAGDGELRGVLESRAAELGWNSIRFLGFKNQTELPALFDLCDVFVLPAEREPWGLVANEVMNAAKPLIVTAELGATPDLVQDGVNGFVFETGNIDQLTAALKRITCEERLGSEMGQRGLERINQWGFEQDIAGVRAAIRYLHPWWS